MTRDSTTNKRIFQKYASATDYSDLTFGTPSSYVVITFEIYTNGKSSLLVIARKCSMLVVLKLPSLLFCRTLAR